MITSKVQLRIFMHQLLKNPFSDSNKDTLTTLRKLRTLILQEMIPGKLEFTQASIQLISVKVGPQVVKTWSFQDGLLAVKPQMSQSQSMELLAKLIQ
jgi:hypothetical protein